VSVLAITQVGDPVLRTPSHELTLAQLQNRQTQALIDDLIETKRAAHGAGLAAQQVGDLRRIAVVEVEPHNPRYPYKPARALTVLVNPILEPVGTEVIEVNEGCLSVPGLRGTVRRFATVRVQYLDREGGAHDEIVHGLTAGTFQHEIDHLDGVLFLDRVEDPATFTTWEEFDRHHREDFERHARAIVERYGS
jgi:peptide deformylase